MSSNVGRYRKCQKINNSSVKLINKKIIKQSHRSFPMAPSLLHIIYIYNDSLRRYNDDQCAKLQGKNQKVIVFTRLTSLFFLTECFYFVLMISFCLIFFYTHDSDNDSASDRVP